MSEIDERNVDPIEEMARVASSFLDLKVWGLRESFRSAKPGNLIYDSNRCRVHLIWGGWDPLGGNSINIRYGRLHAPNEEATMIWNGEECHCWHREELALHFLDGRSPEFGSKSIYTHDLIKKYRGSDLGQSLSGKRRQPEWLTRMHAMLWKHYGAKFFELFDLRHPDLWEQYQIFLKQVYDIRGRNPNITPPLDHVC